VVNRGEATTIATAVDASASIRQNGCVRAAWLRLDQGNGVHISLDSIWRLGGSTLALPWVDLAWRVLFGVLVYQEDRDLADVRSKVVSVSSQPLTHKIMKAFSCRNPWTFEIVVIVFTLAI
jgi:hypothetical protein